MEKLKGVSGSRSFSKSFSFCRGVGKVGGFWFESAWGGGFLCLGTTVVDGGGRESHNWTERRRWGETGRSIDIVSWVKNDGDDVRKVGSVLIVNGGYLKK